MYGSKINRENLFWKMFKDKIARHKDVLIYAKRSKNTKCVKAQLLGISENGVCIKNWDGTSKRKRWISYDQIYTDKEYKTIFC